MNGSAGDAFRVIREGLLKHWETNLKTKGWHFYIQVQTLKNNTYDTTPQLWLSQPDGRLQMVVIITPGKWWTKCQMYCMSIELRQSTICRTDGVQQAYDRQCSICHRAVEKKSCCTEECFYQECCSVVHLFLFAGRGKGQKGTDSDAHLNTWTGRLSPSLAGLNTRVYSLPLPLVDQVFHALHTLKNLPSIIAFTLLSLLSTWASSTVL